MSLKDTYLIAYNSLCGAGWAVVLGLSIMSVSTVGLEGLYNEVEGLSMALTISQTAAILEIIHSALKLVRSPVMVTAMQVSSRLYALYALVNAPSSQNQWGAGLMILSWSLVEVPRYSFYVMALITGDATKKTPYPLFWLRYSLFAVLYPTGICGELTVFFAAAKEFGEKEGIGPILSFVYGRLLPLIYFFGSPYMIFNMIMNRKSAFKKRFAKPPPPPRGLCWPVTDPTTTPPTRSSTETNRSIVAAALQAANPEKAKEVENSKKWRFQYVKHYEHGLIQEQCASPQVALAMAKAGLDKAYELFEFIAEDGSAMSFQKAMEAVPDKKDKPFFYTGFIQGEGAKADINTKLTIPYKGKNLSGQELRTQIQAWVNYGTIEPSAGEAMMKCIDHPEWLKNVQNQYFCLLGAGSAMGPLLVLLALGANVVAIDLDRPQIWKRLIDLARKSPGSITFPLRVPQESCKTDDELLASAGCNLFTHTPMIRDWLLQVHPGKPLTVGSYAYLDGALHVQVSLAMDAICRDLTQKRPNTSLAYLCTPTDLHLIPQEPYEAQVRHFKDYSGRLLCKLFNSLSGGKFLRKNARKPLTADGKSMWYVNGISVAQGPNYALAKRMQHWRAVVAHQEQKCIVSSNVAPSTSTQSVVHNITFAWAYEGMPYFVPFEIFAPETSNAVMSALLLYDLNDTESVANPKKTSGTKLENPNQLFSYNSFHGGVWRCAYQIDSIGEASVFIYFGRVAAPYLMVGVPVLAISLAGAVTMLSG